MKMLARWRFTKSRGRSGRGLHKPGPGLELASWATAESDATGQNRKSSNTGQTCPHHRPVLLQHTVMQIEANRSLTFLGAPAGTFLDPVQVKRTAKTKAAAIPTNGPRWPHTAKTHPRLTPDELARAGYYYAPEPASKSVSTDKGKARRTTSRAAKSTTSKASTSRTGRKTKVSSAISDTDPCDAASGDELATQEVDDQCCCFTCGKKLGGWDETDDPYEEHWKRSEGVAGVGGEDDEGDDIACAWATSVCSVVIHVKRWKDGSLAGTSGKGTTGKRSKTK